MGGTEHDTVGSGKFRWTSRAKQLERKTRKGDHSRKYSPPGTTSSKATTTTNDEHYAPQNPKRIVAETAKVLLGIKGG